MHTTSGHARVLWSSPTDGCEGNRRCSERSPRRYHVFCGRFLRVAGCFWCGRSGKLLASDMRVWQIDHTVRRGGSREPEFDGGHPASHYFYPAKVIAVPPSVKKSPVDSLRRLTVVCKSLVSRAHKIQRGSTAPRPETCRTRHASRALSLHVTSHINANNHP